MVFMHMTYYIPLFLLSFATMALRQSRYGIKLAVKKDKRNSCFIEPKLRGGRQKGRNGG